MAVDDLWYLSGKKGPDGERVPSGRHGRGKRYRVRYVDPTGEPRTRLFEKKGEAERFDVNTRADISRGQYVDANAGKVTFGEFAQEWRTNQVHADTTAAQIESHFRNHVLPVLGSRELRAIRPSAIQALVKQLSVALAPPTVEVVYRYVSAAFKSAVADGLIIRSPCVNASLPDKEKRRVVPLPRAAVDELRASKDPRYHALDDLGSMAGLRQGEAFGVEVPHVDFLRRTLRVEQQITLLPRVVAGNPHPAEGRPFLAPPKSRSSYRTIPISQTLVDRLAAHLAAFPAVEVEILDMTGARPVMRRARLLTVSKKGLPLRRNRFDEDVWTPTRLRVHDALTARATGADAEALRELAGLVVRSTFHDLRHFFASALIAHGASVTQVQHRLGHATATETLNTYSHLWPDEDDRTRSIIDAVFAPPDQDRLRVVP